MGDTSKRGAQWSMECAEDLEKMLTVCSELEDTCKWFHKCVGPLTFIIFLGTEVHVDTVALEL